MKLEPCRPMYSRFLLEVMAAMRCQAPTSPRGLSCSSSRSIMLLSFKAPLNTTQAAGPSRVRLMSSSCTSPRQAHAVLSQKTEVTCMLTGTPCGSSPAGLAAYDRAPRDRGCRSWPYCYDAHTRNLSQVVGQRWYATWSYMPASGSCCSPFVMVF